MKIIEIGRDRIRAILEEIRKAEVIVMGDFGLDAYWFQDETIRDRSVETGRPIHTVHRQRYGLAGAGNVVANLAALGVGGTHTFGVYGNDPFGRELLHIMRGLGVFNTGMVMQEHGWQTVAYGKPFKGKVEQDRIDFGHANCLAPETAEQILKLFDEAAAETATVICNQQLAEGLLGASMVARIAERMRRLPEHRFIVDSRHHGHLFNGAILKLNFKEARTYLGKPFHSVEEITLEEGAGLAEEISAQTGNTVFVTCGKHGIAVYDGAGRAGVRGIPIAGPVDEVGAGDTACAAIAAALDVGVGFAEAAAFANTAAAVTVTKLFETGAATPAEILRRAL